MNWGVAHPSDPPHWSNPFLCTSLSAPCSHIWCAAGPYTWAGKHWTVLLPLFFRESIEFLPDTVNLQVSLLRLAHRIRSDLCCLVQCAFSTCLVTLIRSLVIPEHFLLASHSYRVMDIFYVVKSKAIYYIATSTRPSQNPKPYSRGLNKVICSLSIYTISFLDEYIAQKDSSFRPFL